MSLTFKGPVPVPAPQTSGLNVLVTGASRGIGFELARQYATAHKDNVVLAAVRDPNSAGLTQLTSLPNVHVIQLDVISEDSVRSSVTAAQRFVDRLDVLINNAGVNGAPESADPTKATAQHLSSLFATNVTGVLLTTQAYLPLLRRSSAAKVVNVSSGLGSNALANLFGSVTTAYGVSKASLNYLTTAFRYAVPEVAFFSISPGWVATDMGKAGGSTPPTQTSDSAQAIRYYTAVKGSADSGEFFDVMTGETIPY